MSLVTTGRTCSYESRPLHVAALRNLAARKGERDKILTNFPTTVSKTPKTSREVPMERPGNDEYHEFYETYVSKVPDGSLLPILAANGLATRQLLAPLSEAQGEFRYAEGKWSIKEVLGHMIDSERLFGFRALAFARNDPAYQPGMDQDVWATSNNAHNRPMAQLLDEFEVVRNGHLALFRSFDDSHWLRRGTASGFEISVRALAWIVAGHELHHRGVIEERYFPHL